MCLPLLVLVLAGCGPDLPEKVRLAPRLHPVTVDGDRMVLQSATVEIRALRFRPCPQDPDDLEWPGVPEDVELLPARATPQPWTVGFGDPVDLLTQRAHVPVGPWCRLDVVVDGPLRVQGDLGPGHFDLEIDLPSLGMPFDARFAHVERGTVEVDGTRTDGFLVHPLVLELGNASWIDVLAPELLDGQAVEVGPDDPRHDAIRAALVLGAALYRDVDDDAHASPREREGERILGLVPVDG